MTAGIVTTIALTVVAFGFYKGQGQSAAWFGSAVVMAFLRASSSVGPSLAESATTRDARTEAT